MKARVNRLHCKHCRPWLCHHWPYPQWHATKLGADGQPRERWFNVWADAIAWCTKGDITAERDLWRSKLGEDNGR